MTGDRNVPRTVDGMVDVPVSRRAPAGSSGIEASIALLPGDGVGPEVVAAARLVLESVAESRGHRWHFAEALIGGAAMDATGDPLPAKTIEICRAADAILLGAVGGPKWDSPSATIRPEQGLLGIRQALGLFANLRPVVAEPLLAKASPIKAGLLAGVDLMVVRELTGGIYFGARSCEATADGERATDLCAYTTGEVARITRVAADLSRRRRRRLTSVDKANVLETSRLWRRVVTKIMAEEYPDIQVEHVLVDSFAMRLIQQPATFDVVVTENMFGDILTDEAAVLAGSIGVLPSASLGVAADGTHSRGLYEPIHGSAPALAGRGIANPIGAILSAAMLLRHSLGLEAEAVAVERAVSVTIRDEILTPDIPVAGRRAANTREVAASVASRIRTGKQSRSRAEQPSVRVHSPL